MYPYYYEQWNVMWLNYVTYGVTQTWFHDSKLPASSFMSLEGDAEWNEIREQTFYGVIPC